MGEGRLTPVGDRDAFPPPAPGDDIGTREHFAHVDILEQRAARAKTMTGLLRVLTFCVSAAAAAGTWLVIVLVWRVIFP